MLHISPADNCRDQITAPPNSPSIRLVVLNPRPKFTALNVLLNEPVAPPELVCTAPVGSPCLYVVAVVTPLCVIAYMPQTLLSSVLPHSITVAPVDPLLYTQTDVAVSSNRGPLFAAIPKFPSMLLGNSKSFLDFSKTHCTTDHDLTDVGIARDAAK
jgi:hypothetical protein